MDAADRTTGPSILLVEDNQDIVAILRYLLKREHFKLSVAVDGRQADAMIRSEAPPDLVLLDIMLPFIDGFTLLETIRASETWGDTPVLMLTARAGQKDVVYGLERGADDYVPKPFDTNELMARIRRLLRRR